MKAKNPPSAVPRPALVAFFRELPPMSSAKIAPRIGPRIIPGKGMKRPAIIPRKAPRTPFQVAPKRFAPQ